MASLVAICDLKGKSLIQRSYRDDVLPATVEKFMPNLLEMEENDVSSVTPCFTVAGINYMYIRHNNLYLIALSKRNSNAAEILTFLHKLAQVLSEYFKELEEESIRDNVSIFIILYVLQRKKMGSPIIICTSQLSMATCHILSNTHELRIYLLTKVCYHL
ncbi:uncharacterized protein PGTG_21377 [Puccinia graminis f. sp. tritici CRL 75-36-700-3]|uniref:AP complex mu/sigma subunit domain-containing protein n=1 Tax=Puccinia graminis f. sp. tritici (strain CRL 75-36-700-3 / race SCCL) TaxID=418459 RepID=H6QRD7_PUCGT|nr:uncharacterized protein PGTG_21377 [Puccinia graminis f. sp. tritici CRL 75-36-700-3]EHS63226.1 hypothetical protein PGTG_21377 [Puccinia graminis f. sp. tritici CRL 75-36-700-3]